MAASSKRDYYEVLGVAHDASPDEIKSAYRKAALRWHPDRNPDHKAAAEQRFREASEAYSVLSDPQRRATYDRYGHAGVAAAGFEPGFPDLRDIFGDFFGFEDLFGTSTRRRARRPQRGADLRYDMTLSFEEAAAGLTTKIRVPRLEICPQCHGSGARSPGSIATCRACAGHGQVRYQQGFFTVTRTCPECQGTGKLIREHCGQCSGEGRIEQPRTIEIRIPPGVDSQTRLRIPSEGEPSSTGGPPGDLYVVLEVKEHPFFERRNSDLYCTIPISFPQAALGAEIAVPTLAGEEKIRVPEGAQTGTILRLKGKGLANPSGGSRGDLYVSLRVVTPAKLNREERKLLEMLAQSLEQDNRPAQRSSSFFDRVKDIFG